MPQAAKALRAMGVKFIAVVDGDAQGDDNKRKLIKDVNQPEDGIVSLRDVVTGTGSPTVERLFSQALQDSRIWVDQGMGGMLKALKDGQASLDKESEENLLRLFQMINAALAAEFKRT